MKENPVLQTNIFQNVKTPYVLSTTDIPTVLNHIKQGTYKEKIRESRIHGKGHPIFEKNKSETPTFTPNGTFTKKRSLDNLESLTGLIYLDIDHETDRMKIHDLPFIYSYWKSFSGIGYGLLVSISGLTQDNFRSSWSYLNDYFGKMDINLDPHSKDISRQCVISYDPDIYINNDVVPLIVPVSEIPVTNNISYTGSTTLPDYQSDMTYTDKIKYQTTLDDYGDMDYVVIEDGKEYRNTYLPRIIEDGDRHKWLCTYTNSMLFINPSITFEMLVNILYKLNNQHCHPTLSKEDVQSIVNWSFSKHRNHKLNITTKKKKIWINPDKKLTTKQKKSIVCKESNKLRRKQTISELIVIYKQLSIDNERVTQKLLEQHSTLKIRTIKKYWNEIKEGVFHK